jgi:hypothetical protein
MSVKNPTNNEEFVLNAMQYSRFGAVAQIIIMQGIEQIIDAIISEETNLIESYEKEIAEGKLPFMNIHSWVGAAQEIREKLDKMRSNNG